MIGEQKCPSMGNHYLPRDYIVPPLLVNGSKLLPNLHLDWLCQSESQV